VRVDGRTGRLAELDRIALEHVRFLGGGSGAGKSTVARLLATEYGLHVVSTEPFSAYVERTSPATAPLLHAFLAMDMDERWLERSPEFMRATFHGFHGETFPLVIEDVLAVPPDEPVLVEGFSLLPRLVAPLVSDAAQAVWLLPAPAFRRAAFDSRGSTWDLPGRTSDPDRALANLLARDALFTEDVSAEARALGLRTIDVDVGLTVDELTGLVADALGLC
jgi:2-phosphoglycerate kinase